MKYINELMELTGKRDIKKFAIVFAIMLFYVILQSYGWNNVRDSSEVIMVGINGNLSMWFVYVFIVILLWMHNRRFKRVLQEGSFNRIRLLPIPKMSIVYSELLYVGATYAILMAVVGIGYVSGYVLAGRSSINELFYHLCSNEALSVYLPMNLLDALKSIMMLGMLSYGTVLFLLSHAETDLHMTTKVILVVFLCGCSMVNMFASAQGMNGNPTLTYAQVTAIKIGEMAFVIMFAHHRLAKIFKRKEKAS